MHAYLENFEFALINHCASKVMALLIARIVSHASIFMSIWYDETNLS